MSSEQFASTQRLCTAACEFNSILKLKFRDYSFVLNSIRDREREREGGKEKKGEKGRELKRRKEALLL